MESKSVAVELTPDLEERVQALARAKRRSSSWLLREAIELYLMREERRESLRRDALEAWDEYSLTGEHVSSADADAWLAKLEAGEDVEPPPCRA